MEPSFHLPVELLKIVTATHVSKPYKHLINRSVWKMLRFSPGKLCLIISHDIHHLCRNTLLQRPGSLSARKRLKTSTLKYTRKISIRVYTTFARSRIVKVSHRCRTRTTQSVSMLCLRSSSGLSLKKIDYLLWIKLKNHHYTSNSFRCLIQEIVVISSSLISRLNKVPILITVINRWLKRSTCTVAIWIGSVVAAHKIWSKFEILALYLP